jgi:hypothetical protein
MFAMILSVLVLDDPQDFSLFSPTLDFRQEINHESWPPNWYDTPFTLQNEWVFNRYLGWEISRYDAREYQPVASSLETWTDFTPYLKANFPDAHRFIPGCGYARAKFNCWFQ